MVVARQSTKYSLSPLAVFLTGWKNRRLIWQLAKREIQARYRGSLLGISWSAIVPLLMLCVYVFVFSVIFKARSNIVGESKLEFALVLFFGLIIFGVLSECMNRAPTLLLENVAYIKKLVFPLEIFPWITLVVALVNAGIGFFLLIVAFIIVHGSLPISLLALPLIILPLVLLTLGLNCFLSSIGVFLRDIRHGMSIVTSVVLFLSPIFYSPTAIPEKYRSLIYLNPLTLVIEQSKQVLFLGHFLSLEQWGYYLVYLLAAWLCAWAGFVWFMKTKKGFADVV